MSWVSIVGKIVAIRPDEDFAFSDEHMFRRALRGIEDFFEVTGSCIDGTFTVTFRGSREDSFYEQRVADVVKEFQDFYRKKEKKKQ